MGLKIITPPTVEPVTLAEAKAHCRIDIADDDAQITRMITTAREECEHIVQRTLAPTTYALTLDRWPDGDIRLPLPPVTSITSVQYVDLAGSTQTWAAGNYALDDTNIDHFLRRAYNVLYPDVREVWNAVTVTYVAGWSAAAIPQSVKAWMLLRIGTLYENRETDAEKVATPATFAERLLDEWRVPGL